MIPNQLPPIPGFTGVISETRASPGFNPRPQSLTDLEPNRQKLQASKNAAVRILASRIAEVHSDLAQNKITPEEHLETCHAIQYAADILNGDKGDDMDGVLSRLGLQGKELNIAPDEYLAIHNDLGKQCDPRRGIVATRDARARSAMLAANVANRARANLENRFTSAPAANGGSRDYNALRTANTMVRSGAFSAQQAIDMNRLTHPADVAAVQNTAIGITNSRG